MVRPSLDRVFAMVGGQDGVDAIDLDTQPTLQHVHVLILVGVEVQRWLLRAEPNEVRVFELEENLEAEGTPWMCNDSGCDCAFEAGPWVSSGRFASFATKDSRLTQSRDDLCPASREAMWRVKATPCQCGHGPG